jgi:hypothetical protein
MHGGTPLLRQSPKEPLDAGLGWQCVLILVHKGAILTTQHTQAL